MSRAGALNLSSGCAALVQILLRVLKWLEAYGYVF